MDGVSSVSARRPVVFNGDFVDRGDASTEVLASLLLLKLASPDAVHLLRGNHECSLLSTAYGFREELLRKYPRKEEAPKEASSNAQGGAQPQGGDQPDTLSDTLWIHVEAIFGALPLAARTAEAFVVHGGIPRAGFEMRELEAVGADERASVGVLVPPAGTAAAHAAGGGGGFGDAAAGANRVLAGDSAASLIRGLLWSDPCAHEVGFRPNDKRGGAGAVFGAAGEWLRRHALRQLIRSHQLVEDGWERLACDAEDGCSVWTVFSSASYPGGQGDNKGAILRLVPGEAPSPISYALEGDDLAGEHAVRDGDGGGRDGHGGGRDGGSLFQNLAALILAHKQRLFEAFEKMEAAGDLKRGAASSHQQTCPEHTGNTPRTRTKKTPPPP